MANTILTIEMISLECLDVLVNTLVLGGLCNRQFDPMYAQTGAKVGDTVYARVPPRFIVREGNEASIQDHREGRVPIKLDHLVGIDLEYGSVERTLSLDDWSKRVARPAMATIANKIDWYGYRESYKAISNAVGTPGTVPSSTTANSTYTDAGVKLDNNAAPDDEQRFMVGTPAMAAALMNANMAIFNPTAQVAEAFRKGRYGKGTLGFDMYRSQNVPSHTVGVYAANVAAGAVTIKTTAASGVTVVTTGWTSGDLLAEGDIVTASTCYEVNPQSRESTGALKQWTLAAVPTAAAGSPVDMTLTFTEEIIPSGQFQNCSLAVTAGAVLKVDGASGTAARVGLAFHRDAITLVTAPLEVVGGVHECYMAKDEDTGVSVRVISYYDGHYNRMITRFDALFGWKALRPELATRIWS